MADLCKIEDCIISRCDSNIKDVIIKLSYSTSSCEIRSKELCHNCNEFISFFTDSFRKLTPDNPIGSDGTSANVGHLFPVFDAVHAMSYDESLHDEKNEMTPLMRLLCESSPEYNVTLYNHIKNLIESPVKDTDSTDGACDKIKVILETLLKLLQSKAITKLLAVITKKNDG